MSVVRERYLELLMADLNNNGKYSELAPNYYEHHVIKVADQVFEPADLVYGRVASIWNRRNRVFFSLTRHRQKESLDRLDNEIDALRKTSMDIIEKYVLIENKQYQQRMLLDESTPGEVLILSFDFAKSHNSISGVLHSPNHVDPITSTPVTTETVKQLEDELDDLNDTLKEVCENNVSELLQGQLGDYVPHNDPKWHSYFANHELLLEDERSFPLAVPAKIIDEAEAYYLSYIENQN